MTEKKQKTLFEPSRLVFYILAFIVFYLAVHYIGKLKDIKILLLQLSPQWLLLAFGSQIATYVLNSLILKTLLQEKTGTTNFVSLLKISIVIMFVNQALPSGGVSGNGYVFDQLVKRKVPAVNAFTALLLESICYYFAFLIQLAFFYSWYLHYAVHINPIITSTVITGFVFYTFLGIVMIVISSKRTITVVLNKLHRFAPIRHYIHKANLPSLQDEQDTGVKLLVRNKKAALLGILLQTFISFVML